MPDKPFAEQIRERYPEGLTGVFAVGGTRTTYILEQNRDADDPGEIKDFAAHGEYLLRRYWDLIDTFFELGGQNMIVTAFSFRGFYNRGQEYADVVLPEMLRFINDESRAYYKERQIDPYFAGVEPMARLQSKRAQSVVQEYADFQSNWDYQPGRRKLIWEMASIPLLTFWQTYCQMTDVETAAFEAEMDAQGNLEELYRTLYRRFSFASYGTDVPMPHFYLGTNKSGDLKWRSPLPLALSGGDYLRLFYTPYPSLFTTRDTLQRILEDLAFRERFYSAKKDYSGKYTRERANAEYERVMELRANPENVLGLSRRIE
jgi:hypothetical protein